MPGSFPCRPSPFGLPRASSTCAIPIGFWLAVAWIGIALVSAWRSPELSEAGPVWLSCAAWFVLWAFYLSIVNVGQTFYGFPVGSPCCWRPGSLGIFLGPAGNVAPSILPVLALRWMLVSHRVRRRVDQDSPRQVLAQLDLPLLPPRDAAVARSTELVLPSAPESRSPRGCRVQSLRAASRTVRAVPSATRRVDRRYIDHRPSAAADRERQLCVAQLVDRRSGGHRVE